MDWWLIPPMKMVKLGMVSLFLTQVVMAWDPNLPTCSRPPTSTRCVLSEQGGRKRANGRGHIEKPLFRQGHDTSMVDNGGFSEPMLVHISLHIGKDFLNWLIIVHIYIYIISNYSISLDVFILCVTWVHVGIAYFCADCMLLGADDQDVLVLP